jgi:hypothetical protein
MTHRLLRPAIAALAVALVAPAALAQTAGKPAKPAASVPAAPSDPVGDLLRQGERYHRAPDSAQNPDELRRTQALNDEIVAQNDLAENEDRANAAADAQAEYERRMEDWRATVAACERGDRARCNAGRQSPN